MKLAIAAVVAVTVGVGAAFGYGPAVRMWTVRAVQEEVHAARLQLAADRVEAHREAMAGTLESCNLGLEVFVSAHHFQSAAWLADACDRTGIRSPAIPLARSYFFEDVRDMGAAIQALESATDVYSQSAAIYVRMGQLLLRAGSREEGKKALTRSLELSRNAPRIEWEAAQAYREQRMCKEIEPLITDLKKRQLPVERLKCS